MLKTLYGPMRVIQCHGKDSLLSDLMQMGNQTFHDNHFEEAISYYSRAHNIKPCHPVILSNRCAAYLRLCHFLVHRPPSDSEERPLSGLDPMIHAGLALRDAEKLMNFQNNSIIAHILKADALILLERFELAHDLILLGLQVDPLSIPLRNLSSITTSTIGRRSHGIPQRSDEFDCTLCLKLLYEPLTQLLVDTPAVLAYFKQWTDVTDAHCAAILFINPRTCSISVTLNIIIQKNFLEEYAER